MPRKSNIVIALVPNITIFVVYIHDDNVQCFLCSFLTTLCSRGIGFGGRPEGKL